MENKTLLPKLANLYEDNIELAYKNDQFNVLMNQNPKPEWVKINEYANNSKYIPIGIIETLLSKVFKSWYPEIIREGVAFNGVYVVIRLHCLDLMTNEWKQYDGIGAVELQVKKGSSPAELQNLNKGAIMMAFPMAKSYAIKDAAEHIGKLFGRDLNRKDTMLFEADKSIINSIDGINDAKEKNRIIDFINKATSPEQLQQISEDILLKYNLVDLKCDKLSELITE